MTSFAETAESPVHSRCVNLLARFSSRHPGLPCYARYTCIPLMYFGSYDSIFRTRKHRQRDKRRITESWNRERRRKFPTRLCVPFFSLLAASQTVSLFILDKFDTRDVERYEAHPSGNERALWTLCHCIRITAKYRIRRKSFQESEVNT